MESYLLCAWDHNNIFLGTTKNAILEKIQETLGHYNNIDVEQISAVFHDEASKAVLTGEQVKKVNCMG